MHKRLIYGLVICLYLTAGQQLWAGQVTSFIYHRFDESRYPSTNISAETFRQQLAVLKEQSYQVLSLAEVARRLNSGEALPEKGVSISVDDAFISFAEVAMPIIREYGFPVTLFVNTDAVGTSGYLDWAALKQLYDEGVEIGNHTATHDYLVELRQGEQFSDWQLRVEQDIAKARDLYQQHLGPVPQLFAYPYGEYNSELLELVARMGFSAAFAQQSGVIHADSARFSLPRFPMGGPYATLAGFREKLAMKNLDLRQMNCFVQGESNCRAEPIAGQPGWYQVVADKPLTGRRNKYTLTVAGKQGGWHWYSHLWLRADAVAAGAE